MSKRLVSTLVCLTLLGLSLYGLARLTPGGASQPRTGLSGSAASSQGVTTSRARLANAQSEHFQIVEDSLEGFAIASAEIRIQTNAVVTRAVDGDTIDVKLDSGETARARLLGVDTPETVDPRRGVECFGREAATFTRTSLTGNRVRLEADPEADERDRYGRLLRNVSLEDGTDFNALLIREGYAQALLSFPLDPARKRELKRLEEEARNGKRGLWADGVCNSFSHKAD